MGIYEALARVYDDFFPQNPEATKFLLRVAGQPAAPSERRPRVLDLGCATGSQLLDLAAAGWQATGFEPSAAMLARARAKAEARGLEARFEPLGMLDAPGLVPVASQDLVLCLGNTLPYLSGRAELCRFLAGMEALLAPGGALVLQLINYDLVIKALAAAGFAFPDLEAAGLRFSRRYEPREDGRLDFVTRLEPDQGEGRDALYPIGPGELLEALASAALGAVETRAGWAGRAFDPEVDGFLIAVARSGKAQARGDQD